MTPVPWTNRLHIMLTGNPSWAVPASHNARRYVILHCGDRYAMKPNARCALQKERDDYFQKLHDEMKHGGREAMLYDLLNRGLKDWQHN
jgi:hypothetical protein